MGTSDDDIDLMRPSLDRTPDFCYPFRQRRQAGRKACRYRSHVNASALQCMQSGLDERVINANGRHFDVEFLDPQLLNQILSNWLPSLGTQTAYPLVSVVTGKRCQIHASN